MDEALVNRDTEDNIKLSCLVFVVIAFIVTQSLRNEYTEHKRIFFPGPLSKSKREVLGTRFRLYNHVDYGNKNVIWKCNFAFLRSFLHLFFVVWLARRVRTIQKLKWYEGFVEGKKNCKFVNWLHRQHNIREGYFASLIEQERLRNTQK